MSKPDYYTNIVNGTPYTLFAVGGGYAQECGRDGVWKEINPALGPVFTEFDFLANQRYDKTIDEKEALRIVGQWGTTLPE